MRKLTVVLPFLLALALTAPASAHHERGGAQAFAARDSLPHGIAGDRKVVFITEPGIGVAQHGARVVALDRRSGRQIATLPAPADGFKLPFALRVPRPGHLVVLDDAGFPPQGPPTVYDYAYRVRHGHVQATLTRTVSFAGLPLAFAEDLEVLPHGEYVVSESVVGGLWLVGRDGTVRPGLVPSGSAPLPKLGPCQFPSPGPFQVGDLPFSPPGGFAPGVGSLAVRGGALYFGSSCEGGINQLSLRTLLDSSTPAEQRAATIKTVVPREGDLDTLHGLAFAGRWLYAGDPFRLQLIRVDVRTGERQVVSDDARLFNFPIAVSRLPGGELYVASDQEYRWTLLNAAISQDDFQPPFVLARVRPSHCRCGRHSHPGRRARRPGGRRGQAGRAPARAHAPRVQRVRVQRGR
jgi:hypothetical protein